MAIGPQRVRDLLVRSGLYRPVMSVRRRLRPAARERVRAGTAFYRQFVRPGDLCFDVGANVGDVSEMMLGAGARVVAAEPLPRCAAELTARFGRRDPRFRLVPAAVGAAPGEATLYAPGHSFLASLDAGRNAGTVEGEFRVPVTTLDAMVAEFGAPRFVKVDVEGFEPQVLAGLSRAVPYLSFEAHCGPGSRPAVLACLARVGELGPYEANVTGPEQWACRLPEWLGPAAFLEALPAACASDVYVDVLVRTG